MADLKRKYNQAVERLNDSVAAMRAAGDSADMAPLEREFRAAQAEAEAAKDVLERAEELDSVSHRYNPTGSNASGSEQGRQFRIYSHGENIRDAHRDSDEMGHSEGSLGRALVAMGTGDFGRLDPKTRSMTTGTDNAGGYIVNDFLSSTFFDLARSRMVTSAAGLRTLPVDRDHRGDTSFATVTADATTAWVAEGGTITPSDPTLGLVTSSAKKIAVLVKATRELLADAENGASLIESSVSQAVAVAIDRAVLEGSGSGAEPRGIKNLVGVNTASMGTNGAAPSNTTGPAKLAELALAVRTDNHEPGAMISSPRQWSLFNNLKDTTYQPLRFGAGLDELPWYQTTSCSDAITQGTSSVAGNVYAGDFTKGLLVVRQGLEIFVSRDAYIATDEVAFLITARVDFIVEDAEAFGVLVGVTAA